MQKSLFENENVIEPQDPLFLIALVSGCPSLQIKIE